MTISNKPKLIGLAGTFAGGKDTLAKYLTNQGYQHASTGDMVRQEAIKRFGSSERPVCHKTAKLCRDESGEPGFFVDKALKEYQEASYLVVSGIRTIGELEVIKKADGVLVFVDANKDLRYQRMQQRARDSEAELSQAEFEAQEAKEWNAGDNPADFNLKRLKEMADIVLENNSDLETFLAQANDKLGL